MNLLPRSHQSVILSGADRMLWNGDVCLLPKADIQRRPLKAEIPCRSEPLDRNLSFRITVLSVNQHHLQNARKIDPVLALSLVASFKIIAATPVVAPNGSRRPYVVIVP
jgi:hypothetical protein